MPIGGTFGSPPEAVPGANLAIFDTLWRYRLYHRKLHDSERRCLISSERRAEGTPESKRLRIEVKIFCTWLFGKEAVALEDGMEDLFEFGEATGEEGRSDKTEDTAYGERIGRTDMTGKASGDQAAERRHADEGHRVKTHHPPPLIIVDDRLNNGIAGGHSGHESEAYECEKPDR